MPADRAARSPNAEARSRDRACSTTSWPSLMRVPAAARPRPSVLPVTKMRLIARVPRPYSSFAPITLDLATVNAFVWRQSTPTELRRDVLEDALEHVRVVVHSQRVRDGQEQRIGGGNRLVRGKFLHELVRLRSIRTAEDGARGRVDVADLIALARIASKVRTVAVVNQRKDAAADRYARLARVSGFLPRVAVGLDLLTLLDVQR